MKFGGWDDDDSWEGEDPDDAPPTGALAALAAARNLAALSTIFHEGDLDAVTDLWNRFDADEQTVTLHLLVSTVYDWFRSVAGDGPVEDVIAEFGLLVAGADQ